MSSKRPPKILVLLRHAHRGKEEGAEVDNGLSKKGRRQAALAAEHFRKVRPGGNVVLLCSPKRRCVETLEPLAEVTGGKVKVWESLDEQGRAETNQSFFERVEEFCRWWREEAPPYVVACSHGDWIPVVLETLTGAHAALKKGGWAEVHGAEEPRLYALIQSFDEG